MTEYFDIAITPAVLALQEEKGSLGMYSDSIGAGASDPHQITEQEAELIVSRDSFYMATVSETGWPYLQHRGGDAGFVKILDSNTIGWAERNGNRQYIGTGNITANGRVALILLDYPSRTRLKVYGQATHHADPSPELLEQLGAADLRTDGAITITLLATAWNCPRFITPRFTEEQLGGEIETLQKRIGILESELAVARGV